MVWKYSISSTKRRQCRKMFQLNSSVHAIRYLVTSSANATKIQLCAIYYRTDIRAVGILYLHSAVCYSEGMTSEEQKRYINYLAERVNASDLENRVMELLLQDFLDERKGQC